MTAEAAKVNKFVMGTVTGLLADRFRPKEAVTQIENPLAVIEHFHVGIASYIAYKLTGSGFAHGLSTSLFILEAIEEEPFGIGKPPAALISNMYVSATLLAFLAILEAASR